MRSPFKPTTPHGARRRLAALALAALTSATALTLAVRDAESATGDNVIFILTDDQAASELAAMPNVHALIGARGATFRRAYVPYPLCCPSRASLLSGQYMHNHGVRGNLLPYGGWDRFRPHESNALPVWTSDAGYYNVHIGKYMNAYTAGLGPPFAVPEGWDEWYGKISEGPLYFNYALVEKTGPADTAELEFYGDQESDYQTDVLRDKAVDFLDGLTAGQQPFLIDLWFNAPHAPFDPAPRHLYSHATAPLPKVQAFNEKDISDKPRWLRKQAKKRFGKRLKRTIDTERRRRLEMLRSVDEAVGGVVAELEDEGVLDETYIVFASDNGFFRGEHRIAGGKFLAHEPSSRVPLMIRGPGIPAGVVSDELVSSLDVTQTIVEIATGAADPALDGRSLLPFAQNGALRTTRPILLEADTGPGKGSPGIDAQTSDASASGVAKVRLLGRRGVKDLDQEKPAAKSVANGNFAPAYRGLRTDRYVYLLYANKQAELYDMWRDPAQLRNLAGNPRFRPVRKWLLAWMTTLSTCAGEACRTQIGPDPVPAGKASRANEPKRPRGGPKR